MLYAMLLKLHLKTTKHLKLQGEKKYPNKCACLQNVGRVSLPIFDRAERLRREVLVDANCNGAFFGLFCRSLQQQEMTRGGALMIGLLPSNSAWCGADVQAEE